MDCKSKLFLIISLFTIFNADLNANDRAQHDVNTEQSVSTIKNKIVATIYALTGLAVLKLIKKQTHNKVPYSLMGLSKLFSAYKIWNNKIDDLFIASEICGFASVLIHHDNYLRSTNAFFSSSNMKSLSYFVLSKFIGLYLLITKFNI